MAVCEECFYHAIKCRICWSLWSDDLLSLSWKLVPCYLEGCSISSGRLFHIIWKVVPSNMEQESRTTRKTPMVVKWQTSVERTLNKAFVSAEKKLWKHRAKVVHALSNSCKNTRWWQWENPVNTMFLCKVLSGQPKRTLFHGWALFGQSAPLSLSHLFD